MTATLPAGVRRLPSDLDLGVYELGSKTVVDSASSYFIPVESPGLTVKTQGSRVTATPVSGQEEHYQSGDVGNVVLPAPAQGLIPFDRPASSDVTNADFAIGDTR